MTATSALKLCYDGFITNLIFYKNIFTYPNSFKNSRSKKLPYLKLNLNLFNFKRRKPRYSAPLLCPKVLSFLQISLEQIFKILPFLLEEAFFLFNKCYIQPLLRSFPKVQFHFLIELDSIKKYSFSLLRA